MSISRRSIAENLECAVCLEEFTDPRSLECGHLFCLLCIKKLARKHKKVTCPECRHKTHVGDNGGKITKLPQISTVYRIQRSLATNGHSRIHATCSSCYNEGPSNYMFCDVCKVLCEDCALVHVKNDIYLHHNLSNLDKKSLCPEHRDNIMDLICLPCKTPICRNCLMKSHKEHDWQELEDFMKEIQTGLVAFVDEKSVRVNEGGKLQEKAAKLREKYAEYKKSAGAVLSLLNKISDDINRDEIRNLEKYEKTIKELEAMDEYFKATQLLTDRAATLLKGESGDVRQNINESSQLQKDVDIMEKPSVNLENSKTLVKELTHRKKVLDELANQEGLWEFANVLQAEDQNLSPSESTDSEGSGAKPNLKLEYITWSKGRFQVRRGIVTSVPKFICTCIVLTLIEYAIAITGWNTFLAPALHVVGPSKPNVTLSNNYESSDTESTWFASFAENVASFFRLW